MTAAPNLRLRPDKALTYAAIIIIAGVLATTLAQTQVLARLPLQNLLKNELHADRTANAAFFFWAGLAVVLKAARRHLDRCFPALWQPPQKLYPNQQHLWRHCRGWR